MEIIMAKIDKPTKEQFPGVFPATRKNGEVYYRASLTYRLKHISLGSYFSAEQAHQAYLEGTRLLSHPQINIQDYHSTSPLSFEKWICLLNFRNNGIYFSNPIYIGQKLFYYYMSFGLHRIISNR